MQLDNRQVHIACAYTMRFSNAEQCTDRAIDEFLNIGEAIAPRRIHLPKGVLFLQLRPDDPASGAVYVYDHRRQDFFQLGFRLERDDEHLTIEDFDRLTTEHDLLRYAEKPELLQAQWQNRRVA